MARTFALSYSQLNPADATDAHALALLARAAHFAPGQPIPRDLLLATVTWTQETPDAALQAEDALERLLALGLLVSDATGAVWLHRLLAAFIRAVACDVAAQTAVEDALLTEVERLIGASHPGPILALHPHLQAVMAAAQPREDMRTAGLGAALGDALRIIGNYAGAQPAYERALALGNRVLGPEHPAISVILNSLGTLYYLQGRYDAAEPLLQQALARRVRELGPEHPDAAVGLNNLALLYCAQGRYSEAELLCRRALTIWERVLGSDHPDVAASITTLANVYTARERYSEAELLCRRALTIRERVLGPDHPDVATSLNNLAELYRVQGR